MPLQRCIIQKQHNSYASCLNNTFPLSLIPSVLLHFLFGSLVSSPREAACLKLIVIRCY